MSTSKMVILSVVCLLSVCMQTACLATVQNRTTDPNKAFLDVNDIVAFWQDTYCGLKFTKVAYVERTIDEERNPSIPLKRFKLLFAERIEDGPSVRVNNMIDDSNGLKSPNHDEYAYDGNQTSLYFGGLKRGVIKPGLSNDDKRNLLSQNEMLQYMLLNIQPAKTKEASPDFSNGVKRLLWYLKIRKT